MANTSIGKKFETKFKSDFIKTMPDSFCYRLKDIMTGFKSIGNVSDFICYKYPNCFLIECKAKSGTTFPFSDFRQYDEMLEYKNITGLKAGIVL